jgi:hypothetical protein
VPVKLWYGPPPDPDNPGQLLDRSWRWQAQIDGQEATDAYGVWASVSGHPISEAEYNARRLGKSWDALYNPSSPSLDPERPIDLLKIKPPF